MKTRCHVARLTRSKTRFSFRNKLCVCDVIMNLHLNQPCNIFAFGSKERSWIEIDDHVHAKKNLETSKRAFNTDLKPTQENIKLVNYSFFKNIYQILKWSILQFSFNFFSDHWQHEHNRVMGFRSEHWKIRHKAGRSVKLWKSNWLFRACLIENIFLALFMAYQKFASENEIVGEILLFSKLTIKFASSNDINVLKH